MAEKSGEKAVKEADEIAKNLKKSNISDEAIEAAAKDSGKEGLEKLSKAAEKVGAENADKLAKEGYNLDNVIKLSDKGISPEKYAEYGINSAKDANRAAKYLDEGKNLDEVKELMTNVSDYMRQLDEMPQNKINHIIEGSKNLGHDHKWELLVSNKDWTRIKEIINKTMKDGVEKPYKSVFAKNIYIEGYEVTVTYAKVFDKIVISDAWIN